MADTRSVYWVPKRFIVKERRTKQETTAHQPRSEKKLAPQRGTDLATRGGAHREEITLNDSVERRVHNIFDALLSSDDDDDDDSSCV